ncbi:hypothetical protein M2266_001730 [Streptomyces sp. SPB162]|nr:hypothetical protein [Streptomyces sp. SPB162]
MDPASPAPICSARSSAAALGDHDGVEAAQLAMERDRLRTGRGRVEERPPATYRAGEPGGADQRVLDEVDAGLEAVHDGDDVGRQPDLDGGAAQHARAQLRRGGVVRMRLDDDRAAGGQRARGVAAGDGERERKVAGRVDRDDAERDLVAPQVGAGSRLGGRVRVVDDDVQEGALIDDVGERAQLEGGAGELTGQPAGAERGLGVGRLQHLRAGLLQQVGGGAQQPGAYAAVGERGEHGGRGADGGVDLRRGGLVRHLLPLLPGTGVDGPDWNSHRGTSRFASCGSATVRYAEQRLHL